MSNIQKLIAIFLILILILSNLAYAQKFWRTGYVIRTLTDSEYGGCMVKLDVNISNGCPSTGWVSLDCKDEFYSSGQGNRKLSTALSAGLSGNQVRTIIDNTKKHNGFCVAQRFDILFDQDIRQ